MTYKRLRIGGVDRTILDPFYLIVGHVGRLELLVPHGVKLVRLQITNRSGAEMRRQIARARDICAVHLTQLVVNRHWEIALDLNCSFVHLEQRDMATTDFAALRRAGIGFGLSTHNEADLEQALFHNPDYIALGPLYPKRLHELDRVRRWKKEVPDVPLVAHGGLTPECLPGLFSAGANCAAVAMDFQLAEGPEARCAEWIAATRAYG